MKRLIEMGAARRLGTRSAFPQAAIATRSCRPSPATAGFLGPR